MRNGIAALVVFGGVIIISVLLLFSILSILPANSGSGEQTRGKSSQWFSKRYRALRAFSLPVSVLPVAVATAAAQPPRLAPPPARPGG